MISIITPVYNEEKNIELLIYKIMSLLNNASINYEHIIVDNLSNDKTVEIVDDLKKKFNNIKLIVNFENYGPDFSTMVGIRNAQGCCAIPIDADFQDPPELLLDLINEYRLDESFDLIACIETNKSIQSKIYSAIIKIIFLKQAKLPFFRGFGLYSARLISDLRNSPYRTFFFRGLVLDLSKKIKVIPYVRPNRINGVSSYGILKKFKHLIVAIKYNRPYFFKVFIGLILILIAFYSNSILIFFLDLLLLIFLLLDNINNP